MGEKDGRPVFGLRARYTARNAVIRSTPATRYTGISPAVRAAHYFNFVDLPCATIVQLPPPSTDVSHLSSEDAASFANDSVHRLPRFHPIPVHEIVAPSTALVTYVLTKRPLKPQYMYRRSPKS